MTSGTRVLDVTPAGETASAHSFSLEACARAVQDELEKGINLSIISLVNAMIHHAYMVGASDVHLDPRSSGVQVRLRVDGVLQDSHYLPKRIHEEVISRIKVLSGLRTDEHQTTQDGRFRHAFPMSNEFVDVRVSIAPTYHGENAVLRLLSGKNQEHTLEALGFSPSDSRKIAAAIKRPHGMILATGPTGSGKTTTLYTLIKMLNSPGISIITIEDPIEYAIENVAQIQVNSHTGLNFATGLRAVLRQDPNVIMVGEIRDTETASIAVNTALTGHLLLSTLHTNDAVTTLPRLLDMGVDSYLVASTITLAIGQRLVRRICPHCKKEIKVTSSMEEAVARVRLAHPLRAGEIVYAGIGCKACRGSGYSGRVCVNEVLEADADIREAIFRKAPAAELHSIGVRNGMTAMLEDGFAKVRNGDTTIEEILRVIHE